MSSSLFVNDKRVLAFLKMLFLNLAAFETVNKHINSEKEQRRELLTKNKIVQEDKKKLSNVEIGSCFRIYCAVSVSALLVHSPCNLIPCLNL